MKLLLNDKEIIYFLMSLIDHAEACSHIQMEQPETAAAIGWVLEKKEKYGEINLDKFRTKIKDKIRTGVRRDLTAYVDKIKLTLENRQNYYFQHLHRHIDKVINMLGEDRIIELYKNSKKQNFVKSVGFSIDRSATMVRRKHFTNFHEDCLLRNTVGNENLLISKIDNQYPFWFIDSGYTNFLENKKVWHRLVRNHLHDGIMLNAPVDRLGIFKTFPQQWRTDGDKILIIEPGSFAAAIFKVDLKTWKYEVEAELRKYTDKKIVFREKAPKKTRTKLYKELCDDDYYCVVNINSNAATEAIWAGVPAITLDRHITNPVTRNSLSEINNLYRGDLANWLCTLSYSQFTREELMNGTAVRIVRKYHD